MDRNNITVITFDHGLRKEAKAEALYVKSLCDQLGIKHVILSPYIEEMGKSSQHWARSVRYRHLLAYCAQEKIPYLLFAHHADDQQETLYIRLLQGSHLYGMCGMQPVRNFGNVWIVRPLLKEKKKTLIHYLQANNIHWVDDPSNDNDKYLRVRIRKYLQKQASAHIPHEAIYRWRMHMQNIVARWLQIHASQQAAQIIVAKEDLLSAPLELQLHIVQQLLDIMGKSPYQPSLQDISDKMITIARGKNTVLHHCLIYLYGQHLYFQQEYVPRRMGKMEFLGDGYGVFDDRFHIHFLKDQKITVKPLGSCMGFPQKDLQQLCLNAQNPKNRYILSLPVVFLSQSEYILPMIHRSAWSDQGIHIQRIKTLDNIK